MFNVYLAGMMEFAKDGGVDWRQNVQEKLEAIGVGVFNPCTVEIKALDQLGFKSKEEWALSKNTDLEKYLEGMRAIIELDCNLIDSSACILVYIEEGLRGGTIGELTHAFRNRGIPVFAVTQPGVDIKTISGWALGCVSEFCTDFDQAVQKIGELQDVLGFLEENSADWMPWKDSNNGEQ